ncbi:MAG: hypothetical protein ACM3ZE_27920 [Myxococcales bacterium]
MVQREVVDRNVAQFRSAQVEIEQNAKTSLVGFTVLRLHVVFVLLVELTRGPAARDVAEGWCALNRAGFDKFPSEQLGCGLQNTREHCGRRCSGHIEQLGDRRRACHANATELASQLGEHLCPFLCLISRES